MIKKFDEKFEEVSIISQFGTLISLMVSHA